MIALLLALHVGCWDAPHLRYVARAYGVSAARFVAIAEVESGCSLDPHLRGHHCWHAGLHLHDCEVGRFQIKPSTARRGCPTEDTVWTYRGNTRCAAVLLRSWFQVYGETDGTMRFNGTGQPALEYLHKVLKREEG